MATFVHLTPLKNLKSIQRTGIRITTWRDGYPKGLFAQAVTPNFFISHQWLRELKRTGHRSICAVYFRIPDDEIVWIGHYNQIPVQVPAAEAVGILFNDTEALGYQVFIPRRVTANEVFRVSYLPQSIGWRYYPEAHGKAPCGCPVCLRKGEIKSRKIRRQFENEI